MEVGVAAASRQARRTVLSLYAQLACMCGHSTAVKQSLPATGEGEGLARLCQLLEEYILKIPVTLPATGEGEGLARLRQLLAPGTGPIRRGSGPSAHGAHAGGATGAPSLAVRLSALSPWLASGCLSPRRVYAEVRRGCCIREAGKQFRACSGPKPGFNTAIDLYPVNGSLLPFRV